MTFSSLTLLQMDPRELGNGYSAVRSSELFSILETCSELLNLNREVARRLRRATRAPAGPSERPFHA